MSEDYPNPMWSYRRTQGKRAPRQSFFIETVTSITISAAIFFAASNNMMDPLRKASLQVGNYEELTKDLITPTHEEQIRAGARVSRGVDHRPMFSAGGELPPGSYQARGGYLSNPEKTNAERWAETIRRHEEDYQAELEMGRIDAARTEARWKREGRRLR